MNANIHLCVIFCTWFLRIAKPLCFVLLFIIIFYLIYQF